MVAKSRPEYSAVGAANTDVVITLPQSTIRGRYSIEMIEWSYSGTPTGGRITVAGGGFDKDMDITGGGAGFLPINEKSDGSSDIVITLYAAGAGIVGKLNLLGVKVGR